MQPAGLPFGCSETPCEVIPDRPGVAAFPCLENGFHLGEAEPEPEQVSDTDTPPGLGEGVVAVPRADVPCRRDEEPRSS